MPLQFDRTIKAGDILSSLTVLLSVVALVLSLSKDRAVRVTDQANKVRTAAASVIVKLDRWQAVQLSMYQDLQPVFVELSEDLAKKYDVVATRDRFWRDINAAKSRVSKQLLDEQIATAYVDIVSHVPAARSKVIDVLGKLAAVEERITGEFLRNGERGILSLKSKASTYQTAHLGNMLRGAAQQATTDLKSESDLALNPVREYLVGVIEMKDEDIVAGSYGGISRAMCPK